MDDISTYLLAAQPRNEEKQETNLEQSIAQLGKIS